MFGHSDQLISKNHDRGLSKESSKVPKQNADFCDF